MIFPESFESVEFKSINNLSLSVGSYIAFAIVYMFIQLGFPSRNDYMDQVQTVR